jgi:uncharacterized membrane protein YbhN (UPF0104 family)/SAM-dependent methyltransferase
MSSARRPWVRAAASAAAALCVAGLIVAWMVRRGAVHADELMAAWQRSGILPFLIAGLGAIVQVACQAARFGVIANESAAISIPKGGRIFVFGQAVNLFLPARAGDIGKVVALAAAPTERAAPKIVGAAAVLVTDKLVDSVGFFLMAFLAVPSTPRALDAIRWAPRALEWIGVVAVLLVASWWAPLPARWRAPIHRAWETTRGTLRDLAHPRALLLALGLAIVAWSAEAASLRAVARVVGLELTFGTVMTSLVALNVGTAIPLTPAHIGTFEASLVYGFSLADIPMGPGLAIAGVHHAVQIGALVAWTIVGYVSAVREAPTTLGLTLADKERALDHFRRVAASYEKRLQRWPVRRWRDRQRAAVLELAALDSGATSLIDVGCGPAFYALSAKRSGLFACATDAVAEMLAGIRPGVNTALVADVEALAVTRTYDRVICAGVLDFVASPDVAMKNLASLVAPGGRLVLLVPLRGRGAVLYRMEKLLIGLQVNLFDADWLVEHAGRHGLTLVEKRRPLPWNGVFAFTRAYVRQGP